VFTENGELAPAEEWFDLIEGVEEGCETVECIAFHLLCPCCFHEIEKPANSTGKYVQSSGFFWAILAPDRPTNSSTGSC
jgi:hypothetical protein